MILNLISGSCRGFFVMVLSRCKQLKYNNTILQHLFYVLISTNYDKYHANPLLSSKKTIQLCVVLRFTTSFPVIQLFSYIFRLYGYKSHCYAVQFYSNPVNAFPQKNAKITFILFIFNHHI